MQYYASEIRGYLEQNFTQYEGLTEQWTEQGTDSRYYFDGYTNEGDGIEVKVEINGNEWCIEERLESDDGWVLVDVFSVREGVL